MFYYMWYKNIYIVSIPLCKPTYITHNVNILWRNVNRLPYDQNLYKYMPQHSQLVAISVKYPKYYFNILQVILETP